MTYSVAAALAVRLATMLWVYPDRLDPQRGHWRFGWETGMLARSLALGRGFSSPFTVDSGASAWMGPLYPGLLAGIFRVFGLFTPASALAILTFNCVVSALTCVPVYFIARRTVGEPAARWAAWIWAFFPYAIAIATTRVWENTLTTFLLATLIWLTLAVAEPNAETQTSRGSIFHLSFFRAGFRPAALNSDKSEVKNLCVSARSWLFAAYGLLWVVAALTNPGVLVLLPFALAWMGWRRRMRGERWLAPVAVVALVVVAGLTPWEVRNYRAFHKVIPLRDNFWMEMRVGNTGDMTDIIPDWAHPAQNEGERALYQHLGETAYLAHMRAEALAFIRGYPGEFAWLTVKRFVFTWTGYWSWNPAFRRSEPYQVPNAIFCTAQTILMLAGLRYLRSRRGVARQYTWVYLAPLLVYPAVYYITHPAVEYRHPLDPLIVILIATALVQWRSGRQFTTEAQR